MIDNKAGIVVPKHLLHRYEAELKRSGLKYTIVSDEAGTCVIAVDLARGMLKRLKR